MRYMVGFLDIITKLIYYIFYPSFFIPIVFPGLIFSLVTLLIAIWAERKFAAKVQMRFGPLYASKRLGGFLQLIADAVKFSFAEIIVPNTAIRNLFILGPILITAFSLLPMALIPITVIPASGSILSPYYRIFYDPLVGAGVYEGIVTQFSLFIVTAMASIPPIFIVLTAWASNNRFALISSIREGYLSVSYDVLLLMSLISVAIEYHTIDIAQVVQKGIPGIIMNPLAALVFFVAMLMGTSRFPFDITEADTELVTGVYTEYSGLLFLLSMAGSYILNFIYALLFSDIFLGGWYPFTGLPGAVFTVLKAVLILLFSVFLRSVYGRYRIDQALRGSWKYLFPVSILSIILGMVVGLWL